MGFGAVSKHLSFAIAVVVRGGVRSVCVGAASSFSIIVEEWNFVAAVAILETFLPFSVFGHLSAACRLNFGVFVFGS